MRASSGRPASIPDLPRPAPSPSLADAPAIVPREPAPREPDGPRFSVIITAYDRRTFLPQAIDSVLAQNVPREEYEIIVVKNFEDPEADRRIREHGLIGIYRTEAPLGIHLRAALERTHGESVALLNDDDLWETDRLAQVAKRFDEEPALGFHATSYTVVDEQNRPIDAARDRFTAIARFEAEPGARFRVGPSSTPSESTLSFGRTREATAPLRSGPPRSDDSPERSRRSLPRWTRSCSPADSCRGSNSRSSTDR